MKRTIAVVAAVVAVTALAGDKKSAEAFHGTYAYNGTFTMNMSAPVARTFVDSEEGTLSIGPSGKGDLLASFSTDGSQPCHLVGTVKGPTAVNFKAGQTCTQSSNGAEITITLKSGTASLNGDAVVFDMSWSLSGSIGGAAVTGKATEHVTGDKK